MISGKIKFLFLISALLLQGCGLYSFRGSNPPAGIKTIAVPLFEDNSGFSEAGMKENFTESLKSKIISDNTFVLADRNVSDGILLCTITSVKDDPLVISGNDNVTKRKITIDVKVRFENLNKQKLIWEKTFENWGEYTSSSSGFSARSEGISAALDKITDDIVTDAASNW
jgi:hypothetical protein